MKIAKYLLGAVLALSLGACSTKDDEPGTERNFFTDIVTYANESGTGTTFTFRKDGDSPEIILTTPQKLSSADFTLGSRIVIQYWPHTNHQYTSGEVSVLVANNITGSGAEVPAAAASGSNPWASLGVDMYRLNRTGKYLNFIFEAPYSDRHVIPSRAVVDEATLGSEYPEIHIIYGPDDTFTTTTGYVYGSYSIANLWDAPGTKGVKVYYYDSNKTLKEVTFHKVSTGLTPQD